MKVVRLTLALTFAVFMMAPIDVRGQEALETPSDVPAPTEVVLASAHSRNSADNPDCNSSTGCQNSSCRNCGQACPTHGKHCRHNCLKSSFGYGPMASCPKNGQRPCPIHGYGACPTPGQGFAPAVREAFQWSDRPYFGDRPLFAAPGYGPHGHYGVPQGYAPTPGYPPGYGVQAPPARFPKIRTLLYGPQIYMTTRPAEPLPTYTTRSPRDFLHPNPPSIGY